MTKSMEEKATIQSRMIEYACKNEDMQDDPEALATWAMKEWGFAPEEMSMASMFALSAVALIQRYRQSREQARSARTPQRREPSKAFLFIIPSKGKGHFLHESEEARLCLHQTALVGAVAEYMGRSFTVHDDPRCVKMMGAIQGSPAPFKLIGNEGYAPCSGCALPLAGPSLAESLAYPPLPVPADLADLLYGKETPLQVQPRRTRRKQNQGQLSLLDCEISIGGGRYHDTH